MEIARVFVSQRKLRDVEQLGPMICALQAGEVLPPIVFNRDSSGAVQVSDGHHRLCAVWLSGRRELRPEEYILVESDRWRPRFGSVVDLLCRCGIRPDGEAEITPGFEPGIPGSNPGWAAEFASD